MYKMSFSAPLKRLLDPATRSISNKQKQFIKSIAVNRERHAHARLAADCGRRLSCLKIEPIIII